VTSVKLLILAICIAMVKRLGSWSIVLDRSNSSSALAILAT